MDCGLQAMVRGAESAFVGCGNLVSTFQGTESKLFGFRDLCATRPLFVTG
jgi:hypothetical protein